MDKTPAPPHRRATRLVHGGRNRADSQNLVNVPPFRGSTVLYPNSENFLVRRSRFTYGIHGNPTSEALCGLWSELEGAAGTVITSSGLSACTTPLLAFLAAGDHLLVSDNVYRPTRTFCDGILVRFGVETTYFDPMIGEGLQALLRPNTKVVYLEAPGSLSFEVCDTRTLAAVARAHGAVSMIDNTWATPLLFRPLEHGVDISIQAATKYPSGHSDVMIGLVAANAACLPRLRETNAALGQYLGPDDVYLVLRGLRSMELRLREQGRKALDIAHWLSARPEVLRVLHPALPECPGHAFYMRDFEGSAGLFSIVLDDATQSRVNAFVDSLTLFGIGASWGGYESLAIPFNLRGIRKVLPEDLGGGAVRLQIGLEDQEDLISDLEQGFAAYRASA